MDELNLIHEVIKPYLAGKSRLINYLNAYLTRFDNCFFRYLKKKSALWASMFASQKSLLTIILINMIPLAYLYGESCASVNPNFWSVFKNEYHVILPFAIVSFVFRYIRLFLKIIGTIVVSIIALMLSFYLVEKLVSFFFNKEDTVKN